jgi:putative CocE/NonD family hydrolase
MRDGVRIAIDVLLPAKLKPGERIPTILRQTRYWRETGWKAEWALRLLYGRQPNVAELFIDNAYAWVSVDVRGTGASFGRWPGAFSPDEIRDGAEVVDWIVKQPWSNGKVGALGVSYEGGTAQFLLVNKHPAVKAVAPKFVFFDVYADAIFPGGIYLRSNTKTWNEGNRQLDHNVAPWRSQLPWYLRPLLQGVKPVDIDRDRSLLAQAVREHANNADVNAIASQATYRDDIPLGTTRAIDRSSLFSYAKEVEASGSAIYNWSGWFDGSWQNAAIKRYLTLKNPSKLIIGPWSHGDFFNASPCTSSHRGAFTADAELLRFFDFYLKEVNNGIANEKPILYFTMGEEKWKTTDTWPIPGTQAVPFYFGAGRRLAPDRPAEADTSDTYMVNTTAGTGSKSRWDTLVGSDEVDYPDRRETDARLLCYNSAPLQADTEVTGHAILTLFVSSTANDGEFFAYLEDVDPSESVTYVTEGELRALHRKLSVETPPYRQMGPYHSFKRRDALPLVPGEVAELTFELLPTSYLFKRGHSIRVSLAGADKDHFAILPGPDPTWRVYRDSTHPSRISLPVISHGTGGGVP